LDGFVEDLFSSKIFNPSAPLITSADGSSLLSLPDVLTKEVRSYDINSFDLFYKFFYIWLKSFEEWLEGLPDISSPILIGLPANAEKQLMKFTGQKILSTLAIVQDSTYNDEEGSSTKAGAQSSSSSSISASQGGVGAVIDQWIKAIEPSKSLRKDFETVFSQSSSKLTSPVERFLFREVEIGCKVLSIIGSDLLLLRYTVDFFIK
jgi:hypothetical protein